MKIVYIVISVLIFTGCVSKTVSPLADGQYFANYSGTVAGFDSTTPIEGVMKIAKQQCGDKSVKIVNLTSHERTAFSHPGSTLVFECN